MARGPRLGPPREDARAGCALCCAAGQGSRTTSPGSPTRECAVLERRHGSSPPKPACLSPTLGPRDEDTGVGAPWNHEALFARRVGNRGVKNERNGVDVVDHEAKPRASRVAGGGALRLGQGAGPTRIAQGRRVGRLQPKLCSLGVAGEFGDVVESAEIARRGGRECQAAPPRVHNAMASARRARRRRGRFARRRRRRGGKCR